MNELKISGAEGIEVGNQRITAISSIRCVGPTILVNNRPISVNPVVIKAVGNPHILKSSLDLIKKQLGKFGLILKIEIRDNIVLGQSY